MDRQMDRQVDGVLELSKIFSDHLTEPFSDLLKALRERAGIKPAKLSAGLDRAKGFISKAEAGRYLLQEIEMKKLSISLGLNDGFASDFAKRWRENYEEELTNLFKKHLGEPFHVFFRLIRERIGISSIPLCDELKKNSMYISNVEGKKVKLPEELALKAAGIFLLRKELADEFMARWKKYYDDYEEEEEYHTKGAERPVIDPEELENVFEENDLFLDLLKGLRKLHDLSPADLSLLLNRPEDFIAKVENSETRMAVAEARKTAESFSLNERLTSVFLDRWEDYANIQKRPPAPARTTASKPAPSADILNTPMGRLVKLLCEKAGFDLGPLYLQRNGELDLCQLGPNADKDARLIAVCNLAKRLKLKPGSKEIYALATLIFANHPAGYSLEIKIQGEGINFLETVIGLAVKPYTEISINKHA